MHALLICLAVAILAIGAEVIHWMRIRKVKHLAFGSTGKISFVTMLGSPVRVLALAGLAWSLTTLLMLPPKAHRSKVLEDIEPKERHHLMLVLDVSPSMKLQDAGEVDGLSRTKRASALIQSLLKRTTDNKLHITMVAVYNGAKPVVQESRDLEVILNFLDDIDMYQVFPTGKTRIFDGLEEAAKIAKPWPANSTTLLLVSDGDTVPSSGMPKMPKSIGGVLVLGVGDPTKGSFIDGQQSRQDTGALRQIASRLGGEYHDGNIKHVPTDMLTRLGTLELDDQGFKLTKREYALIICATSSFLLAVFPIILYLMPSTLAD
ncbi:MAG: VWA domain-containing protein [Akkermansiaceae bacterium]